MAARSVRSLANGISTLRLAVAPAFVGAVLAAPGRTAGWLAAALFAIAAASDVADGRVARRYGTATAAGRVLDHGADIIFLLSAFAAYVWIGVVPWWVPAAIAAAFAWYVADALRGSPGGAPIGSRIGHLGGVGNYVLLGVLVGNETLALHWLPRAAIDALCALVPVYSGAAIAARLVGRRRAAPPVPALTRTGAAAVSRRAPPRARG